MSDFDDQSYDLGPIFSLARSIQDLNRQAIQIYTPVVDAIVRSRCRDVPHIEQTLDGLLSFCSHDDARLLYKKLCRYYFDIDPLATAEYVYAYRDLWDSEDEESDE